jgi:hypothetical protein
MATRNVKPRADGEGNIGTSLMNWLKGWFKSIFVSGNITDGSNNATVADLKDAVDKKHTQLHAIDSVSDHSSSITENNLIDADSNGLPDDSGLSVSNVSDAITKKHTQNTDTGTNQNSFGIGDSADTDKTITAEIGQSGSQPGIKYDVGDDEWQFSNDGTTWTAMGGASGTRDTFDNGDLVAGVLTITHSLGLSTPFTLLLTIANDSQQMIIPDEITFLTNTITVDLSSFGVISGTWGYYYI